MIKVEEAEVLANALIQDPEVTTAVGEVALHDVLDLKILVVIVAVDLKKRVVIDVAGLMILENPMVK